MFISRLSFFTLLFTLKLTWVQAFTVSPAGNPTTLNVKYTSTCRYAQDGEGESTEAETPPEEEKQKKDSDILSSPDFLKRKVDVLNSDIKKAEQDLEDAKKRLEEGKAEWAPQLEELQKEYKAIQERMNTRSQKGDADAIIQVAREMLKVLDNFDRAFGAVQPETEEQRQIEQEYKLVYDTILETFNKLGVEEVASIGTEFDYELHQAIMQKPSDEFEEGIVCEEFQKGYKLGDQLIRASMVAVAV